MEAGGRFPAPFRCPAWAGLRSFHAVHAPWSIAVRKPMAGRSTACSQVQRPASGTGALASVGQRSDDLRPRPHRQRASDFHGSRARYHDLGARNRPAGARPSAAFGAAGPTLAVGSQPDAHPGTCPKGSPQKQSRMEFCIGPELSNEIGETRRCRWSERCVGSAWISVACPTCPRPIRPACSDQHCDGTVG